MVWELGLVIMFWICHAAMRMVFLMGKNSTKLDGESVAVYLALIFLNLVYQN